MKWRKNEINRLDSLSDYPIKNLVKIFNRDKSDIVKKLVWLKKTNKLTEEYKNSLPIYITICGRFISKLSNVEHKYKKCGHVIMFRPNQYLGYCPECGKTKDTMVFKKRYTTEQYKEKLPEHIEVLEDYIRSDIKILHKHKNCGYKWHVRPNSILSGSGCPNCAIKIKNKPIMGTYLVYLPIHNIYKIGHSKDIYTRIRQLSSYYNLILYIEFDNIGDAINLENKWLYNVNKYLYNTRMLRSGNTETFRI